MTRWVIISFITLIAGGCADASREAFWTREQTPGGGSPESAWLSDDGRCLIESPLRRLSCRAIIRRDLGGQVRLVLLADEGPLVLDLLVTDTHEVAFQAYPDVKSHLAALGHLVRQVWGPGPTVDQNQGTKPRAGTVRTYGGDPLLLRSVTGGGPSLVIGDYRWTKTGNLAHCAAITFPGGSVTLTLGHPQPLAAPNGDK
jgi:hypothetical protein